MDPADIAKAMDYYYEAMGWDKATGAPSQARYAALGLADVGEALAAAKLTPEAAK
jgi:aldehyde:ferredoxin oxidoreductase